MGIDESFYKNLKPFKKHHDHYVWGPGKIGAAAEDQNAKTAYERAGKPIKPLGVHGTYVAVDWDDCIGLSSCRWICSLREHIKLRCEICQNESCVLEGACLWVCPTIVFEWAKNSEQSAHDGKRDFTEKADPIREADCIFCMVCVDECPTNAILIDKNLVNVHNNIKL